MSNYKYNKEKIESIAIELMEALSKHHLSGDACIYVNGVRYEGDYDGSWIKNTEEDFHGQNYCEYAGEHQIIDLSTEGPFYDWMYEYGTPDWYDAILDKYELYQEACYNWFHVIVPCGDWDEWETYQNPTPPKEKIHIYSDATCPDDQIMAIRNIWANLIASGEDEGACVVGSGMDFEYNDNRYFMSPPSIYQGSVSWERHVSAIKTCLERAGAKNVWFNYGMLD